MKTPRSSIGTGVVAQRADVGDVGVQRIDDDARDVMRVCEAQIAPRLAAIERLVHAVAEADAVARVGLARAHPDDVRIMRIDRDVADGDGGLVIENRSPGGAAVGGLEQAARGGGDVDQRRIAGNAFESRDAAAHGSRTDVSPLQAFEQFRIEVRGRHCSRGESQDNGDTTDHSR